MADDTNALEYIAAAACDPRIRPEQLREFVRDIAADFGVRPSSSAAVSSWIDMWLRSTPKPTRQEGDNVIGFKSELTRFRSARAEAQGLPAFPFVRSPSPSPASADTPSTLAAQIIAADRRARGEASPAVEKAPEQHEPIVASADAILIALAKAEGRAP